LKNHKLIKRKKRHCESTKAWGGRDAEEGELGRGGREVLLKPESARRDRKIACGSTREGTREEGERAVRSRSDASA